MAPVVSPNKIKIIRLDNKSGHSLVELLISVAITSIFITGIAAFTQIQAREIKSLQEFTASLDVQRQLVLFVSKSTTCSLMFDAGNFVSPGSMPVNMSSVGPGNPLWIDLKSIPILDLALGQPVSPLSNSLKINSVGGLRAKITSSNSANLEINFDQTKLTRSIRPLQFPLRLISSGPINAVTITGCGKNG